MDRVTAAVFRNGGDEATLERLTLAPLRPEDVLVRLVATGICHTDITCRSGFLKLPRPIILGHEGAGVVERVGSAVTAVLPGDHVVLTFMTCGACTRCRDGDIVHCEHFRPANFSGRRLDGTTALAGDSGEVASHFFGQSSFATHSVASERNVVKVRQDAPLELLGPLGCGVQTGAGTVMNVLKPAAGDSIAVFGAGGVGLSAVMAAKVMDCDPIIVVEPNSARRAVALEVGATHAIDPRDGDMPAKLKRIGGGGIKHAADTCGIPAVIDQAIEALDASGRLALVTVDGPGATLSVPILTLMRRSLTISGVTMGESEPKQLIPQLVDLVMDGRFPLGKLTSFYSLDQINQALADQDRGTVIKPVIRF